MNSKDGEWRLIYVGPNGRLIGSLKPVQPISLAGLPGILNPPPGATDAQIRSINIGQGLGQIQPGNSQLGSAIGGGSRTDVHPRLSTAPPFRAQSHAASEAKTAT